MAEKQGGVPVPGLKSRTNFAGLFPEDMPISGVSRGVEFLAEGIGLETTPEGRRFSGQVPLYESAKQGLASIAQDPMGAFRGAGEAISGFLEEQMQASSIRPGEMVREADGTMRQATSEELTSALDPTLGGTFAAPLIARGAVGGLEGLMPQPGVVSLFGSAERVPERQATALRLKAEGVPEQKIFEETGVFYGDDGLLRFEIDDRKAKFKGGFSVDDSGFVMFDDIPQSGLGFIGGAGKQKPVTLGDILDHEELYKYYPEAKDIPVRDVPFLSLSEGSFDPINEVLMVNRRGGDRPPKEAVEEVELTLLHELQHYLQYKHDFDTGGAKRQFLPKDYDAVRSYVSNELDSFDKVLRENNVNPMGAYRLEPDLERINEIEKRIASEGPLDPEIDKFTIEDYNAAKERVDSFKGVFDDDKQFNEYLDLLKSQEALRDIDAEAFNAYKRLSGEAEARQVEFRKSFPTEEEVAAGADDYSRLKPFSSDEFIEMERVETPDPRLIGDAIPSPASGNRSQEYYAVTNSIKDKFDQALDLAGYKSDKPAQKFRDGGIVALGPRPKSRGLEDVIRKYRREGLMD